jgi:hypothetical protein
MISAAAIQWLANGERGLSSETIFETLTGMHCKDHRWSGFNDYPHDPDDLRRCVLLLERVPEFIPRLREMRAVSPTWARLVDAWDELTALLKAEAPSGTAPKCYARMQEVIRGGK